FCMGYARTATVLGWFGSWVAGMALCNLAVVGLSTVRLSQAVRIPREFHLEDDEVEIRRRGRTLVLAPRKRSWSALFEGLDKFTDDFMTQGRKQPPLQKRRRTF